MNVNTLMTMMADSIRSKTGKTEKLSLQQMVAEVYNLASASAAVNIESGVFTATSTGNSHMIMHSLGVTPHTVLFFKNGNRKNGNSSGTSGDGYNFYDVLFAAKLSNGSNIYTYNNVTRMSYYSSSSATSPSYRIMYSGNHNKSSSENANYCITEVDHFSFKTPAYLQDGAEYMWIAIGEDVKSQVKEVTPAVDEQVVLPDAGYTHLSQVTVKGIPYSESVSPTGGIIVTIG